MKKEIDPKDSPRGRAFELWKTAGMPKVTIVKTFDVGRLVRVAKRNGMKTNMLMWRIKTSMRQKVFSSFPKWQDGPLLKKLLTLLKLVLL